MSISIDIPIGLSDLDKIFATMDLLDNREELIKEFTPEVSKFMVKDGFFKGPFRRRYEQEFDNLVISLIRREIIKHYPQFTPEEVVLLTDRDFLKMITEDFYFIKSNYLPKEGNQENGQYEN